MTTMTDALAATPRVAPAERSQKRAPAGRGLRYALAGATVGTGAALVGVMAAAAAPAETIAALPVSEPPVPRAAAVVEPLPVRQIIVVMTGDRTATATGSAQLAQPVRVEIPSEPSPAPPANAKSIPEPASTSKGS